MIFQVETKQGVMLGAYIPATKMYSYIPCMQGVTVGEIKEEREGKAPH
jgi:hypothetical protein